MEPLYDLVCCEWECDTVRKQLTPQVGTAEAAGSQAVCAETTEAKRREMIVEALMLMIW